MNVPGAMYTKPDGGGAGPAGVALCSTAVDSGTPDAVPPQPARPTSTAASIKLSQVRSPECLSNRDHHRSFVPRSICAPYECPCHAEGSGSIKPGGAATDSNPVAVIEPRDGRWAAFEVKLGVNAIDSAARSLLDLSARVDHDRCGPPAALVVITSTGYAYRRPDGVSVVPIGALGR